MTLPKLPIDFNSADDERTFRLNTQGTLDALKKRGLILREGLEILVTDDELMARALVTMRDGVWVAVVQEWMEEEN